jgi:hypothetical protein
MTQQRDDNLVQGRIVSFPTPADFGARDLLLTETHARDLRVDAVSLAQRHEGDRAHNDTIDTGSPKLSAYSKANDPRTEIRGPF